MIFFIDYLQPLVRDPRPDGVENPLQVLDLLQGFQLVEVAAEGT